MAVQPPRPKMPPLTALRAFEAAGRLGGFTPAALELGVTPGAVTAHLKTLETAIGAQLFERRARSVELTELGARVLPGFTQAFRDLETAMRQLEAEAAPDLVRIASTRDLSQLWLSPRLRALRDAGLKIVLVTVDSEEAARSIADLGVFMGDSDAPGLPLIAVAAPELADRWETPADLDPDHCLQLSGPWGDWARWGAQAGLPAGFAPQGAVHDGAPLALSEASYGAGVLVIAQDLAQEMLDTGRLVALFGVSVPSGAGIEIAALRKVKDNPAARMALQILQNSGAGEAQGH